MDMYSAVVFSVNLAITRSTASSGMACKREDKLDVVKGRTVTLVVMTGLGAGFATAGTDTVLLATGGTETVGVDTVGVDTVCVLVVVGVLVLTVPVGRTMTD